MRQLTHRRVFNPLFVIILLATLASPAVPQSPPARADQSERFRPFEFLARGTWLVEAEPSAEPVKIVTEYSFEWVLGGKFLQSRHTSARDGQVLSSSISLIGWDAERQSMAQWGFNNTGITAVLHVAPGATQDSFALEGRIGSGEKAPRIRSTYRRVAENQLEVFTEMMRDGKFVPVATVRLKRSFPANPKTK